MPTPAFEKFSGVNVPVKSFGYSKDFVPRAAIAGNVLIFVLNAPKGFGPLINILTAFPLMLYGPESLFVIITVKDFAGLGQKEFPQTILTDVISISWEKTSGEWNINIKKNIFRKCLISFLILISFNVLQN